MESTYYIIIDASSYINMSNVVYINGTLLDLFTKTQGIVLRYSATVNQEIERHCIPEEIDFEEFENDIVEKVSNWDDKNHMWLSYHKTNTQYVLKGNITNADRQRIRMILNTIGYPSMSNSLERDAQVYRPQNYDHQQYERRLFDNVSEASENKGEKDNFAVALDLFLKKKKRNLIFLTDDDNAIKDNGCLSELIHAFPIIKTWSSFDVVLFLYLLRKREFPIEVAREFLKDLHKRTISKTTIPRESKMKQRQAKLDRYLQSLARIQSLTAR